MLLYCVLIESIISWTDDVFLDKILIFKLDRLKLWVKTLHPSIPNKCFISDNTLSVAVAVSAMKGTFGNVDFMDDIFR